jgi:pectate lyase
MKSPFLKTLCVLGSGFLAGGFSARADQGFGAGTPGGSGKPVVHVTNLNDSGAGSLRAALSAGNRTVVFDVAGDIVLSSHLYVQGPFVTLDGTSAPARDHPAQHGLHIRSDHGAYDVIVRSIRVRDAVQDGIRSPAPLTTS